MRRRDFVQRLPLIPSGIVVGTSSLVTSGCAGAPYVSPRTAPGRLLVDASTLGIDTGIFVQRAGMERPIYLWLAQSGEPSAVLASCTHRGCQPEPVGERLVCPCHGSQFSLDGSVLEGPADRPLTRYAVTREGEDLVIWLREGAGP
jgi:thiosulfate dehydrogenase [quinone] large subunit